MPTKVRKLQNIFNDLRGEIRMEVRRALRYGWTWEKLLEWYQETIAESQGFNRLGRQRQREIHRFFLDQYGDVINAKLVYTYVVDGRRVAADSEACEGREAEILKNNRSEDEINHAAFCFAFLLVDRDPQRILFLPSFDYLRRLEIAGGRITGRDMRDVNTGHTEPLFRTRKPDGRQGIARIVLV